MQKEIFVKILSILQGQKIPKGIRIRLENHFPQLETAKNPIFLNPDLSKIGKLRKHTFWKFRKKNDEWLQQVAWRRKLLCLLNVSFLVKIEGLQSFEEKMNTLKSRSAKKSERGCFGIFNIRSVAKYQPN